MLTPSQAVQPSSAPLVSMLVICYNQARFVVETLESVKAQTYKDTELIIVDDCSTDDSVAVIERWLTENRIQCTFIRHQKNQGVCRSLNDALAVATGKYISEIAADDLWLPDKIERQVAIMESQPDSVGVLYSDAFQIDENGCPSPGMFVAAHRDLPEMPQGQILNTLLEGNFIPGMTTLIRRDCYGQVGTYDENLPWEDWDMWMRIARHYSFLYSSTPSAKYRFHGQSYSHSDPARMYKDSFKISVKQFRLGSLTEEQKSTLAGTMMNCAREVYSRNDPETTNVLLDLWQTTGNKRARLMYWSSRLGVSLRTLQRVYALRLRFRHLPARLLKSQ
ncbi:MAG TPA: glycosyltransferase [Candidatus Acidoferrales bacterium]|nr:glycosyltransferase [Candidatus Acidoferrales bacterium]